MNPQEYYRQSAAACRTNNDFHRLHIIIETFWAPLEVASILEMSRRETMPPQTMPWLLRLQGLMDAGGRYEPYRRQELAPAVHLYEDPDGDARDRTLVIAFAGDAQRLMLPIPVFLQQCPATAFSFLVLRDLQRCYYLNGVRGLAPDFPQLLRSLGRLVDRQRYRRTFMLGSSGGGLAAVAAAMALGADRGIGICATSPALDDPRLAMKNLTFAPFAAQLTRREPPLPEIVLAFGADCIRDAEKAESLAGLVPARLQPVAGVASHNLLAELLLAGRLRSFLAEMLAPAA